MNSAQYVYAIVHRDDALTAITSGLASDLTMVPCRELAAVTRRVRDGEGVPVTTKGVLQHEMIVEALRSVYPALPVRFGTVFRDAAAIACAMTEQYEQLVADLARVGDKAELSVTALWDLPPSGDDARGRSDGAFGQHEGARYMRARAFDLRRDEAKMQEAQAVADKLDDALGILSLECRKTLLPTPRIVVRAAYLLEPANVGPFRAAFDALRAPRSELRWLLTGPWPPYNFVRRPDPDDPPGRQRLADFARLLTDAMEERRG